ncbi:hypothetical protein ACG7TL_007559 [Trametes sanguinea]
MAPMTRSQSFLSASIDDNKVAHQEPDAVSRLEDARERVRANSRRYATAAHLWRSHAFYGEEEAQALQEEYLRRVAKEEELEIRRKAASNLKGHSAHASGDEAGASNRTLDLKPDETGPAHSNRRNRPMKGREPSDRVQYKPARKRALTTASSRPRKKARVDDLGVVNEVAAQGQPGQDGWGGERYLRSLWIFSSKAGDAAVLEIWAPRN